MSAGENYVEIRCRIDRVREKSVWILVGDGRAQRARNIPRPLIHGADETRLDGLMHGEETVLRVFKWKADELGLTAVRDAAGATGDLFGEQ